MIAFQLNSHFSFLFILIFLYIIYVVLFESEISNLISINSTWFKFTGTVLAITFKLSICFDLHQMLWVSI